MQVAVAGMKHVGDLKPEAGRHLAHLGQHLGQAAARDGAVHAVVIGRDAADRRKRRLAAQPEPGALVVIGAGPQRGGAQAPRDVGNALDQFVHLGRRAVQLDDQKRLGIHRVTRADERFGGVNSGAVHHFHASRHDALCDHLGHARPRRLARWETDQQRARDRRTGQDAHRHLRDDAQQPFRAGDDAQQVEPFAVEMTAAQAHHLAGDQHDFDAQQVVGGEAVLQAMHAARIFSHVAADGAGDLAGGIGRVIKALALDRLGDGKVGDAWLGDDAAVVVIDVENAVELAKAQRDAVGQRQRAARKRRAGAARHDLDAFVMAPSQHGGDLGGGFRQHDDQRQLAIGGEPIRFIGAQRRLIDDHPLAHGGRRQHRLQAGDQSGPPGDDRGIGYGHQHGLNHGPDF